MIKRELSVGRIHNHRVIASREVLLLLKINLTKEKAPKFFLKNMAVVVSTKGGLAYDLYSTSISELASIAFHLSHSVRAATVINLNNGVIMSKWENGVNVIADPNGVRSGATKAPTKPTKLTWWGKLKERIKYFQYYS